MMVSLGRCCGDGDMVRGQSGARESCLVVKIATV